MNQNKRLLDFKGLPEYILESLLIIKNNRENWEAIKRELVKMVKRKESQASDEVIVSAYITPFLRDLELIEGNGNNILLTAAGNVCILANKKGGEKEFKKKLSQHVIDIDKKNIDLISIMQKNHFSRETATDIENMKKELFSFGVTNATKSSPVPGWFRLLHYLEILEIANGGKYFLPPSRVESIINGEKTPTKKEFINSLKMIVTKLKTSNSPYVPIPLVRSEVCTNLYIRPSTFNDFLKKLPSTFNNTRIAYATPIKRVTGGMTIGQKYYYFIAIF